MRYAVVFLAACFFSTPPSVTTSVSADTPAVPASMQTVVDPESAPAWTKQGARFEERDGKRYAVAAASVKLQNPQLARDAAANRARAAILRLLQNKGPTDPVEGTLNGSTITKSETNGQMVSVEVEVEVFSQPR